MKKESQEPRKKVLMSVLDNYGGHPFDTLYDLVVPVYGGVDVQTVHDLGVDSTLIVWGGEDISPTIYNQVPNAFTGATEALSRRDQLEVEMVGKAMDLGIPIIGICRGAQLMCAMSGGSLVQHVEGHAGGYHKILTDEGEILNCPSLHHQMMYPWPRNGRDGIKDVKFLAWCPEPRSSVYYGEPDEKTMEPKELTLQGQEPEILWIPKTKSLCIQSHPEFIQDLEHPFVKHCLKLTKRWVLGESN